MVNEYLIDRAVEALTKEGEVSISILQQRLRLGYGAALDLMAVLESRGILTLISERWWGISARKAHREMAYNQHPVITKSYPENRVGGIMVCGINFGYSEEDERVEKADGVHEAEPLSFFSDTAVNDTRFRNRLLTWLSLWDIPLETKAGNEGGFERSFFQTNWLPTQTRSVSSDGVITTNVLVNEADSFLALLQERMPKTVVFVGAVLIEALNDIRLRERVESILGVRSGNAVIHRADSSSTPRKAFKLLTQSFGSTQIISLPHVQSRGLTDNYMAGFGPVVQSLLRPS